MKQIQFLTLSLMMSILGIGNLSACKKSPSKTVEKIKKHELRDVQMLGNISEARETQLIEETEESDKRYRLEFDKNFVRVEGGVFEMGCDVARDRVEGKWSAECYDYELPLHTVSISTFYMSKYEVTQGEWEEIMGSNPSNFKNCSTCPVESVSWEDVEEYISRLNAKTGMSYRLPSEAEWEYASRGGNRSKGYMYSGSNDLGRVAWCSENSDSKPHPVGGKLANELGLHDMSGNVQEWCMDNLHMSYEGAPVDGRVWLSAFGAYRMVRGGCWYNNIGSCRSVSRHYNDPAHRFNNVGFRLVRS